MAGVHARQHSEHSTDCIYHVRAPPVQSTSASRRQQAVVETSPHWHGHGLVPHSARTAERGRALEPTELVRAERCGHQRCPKRKSAPCNSVFIILVLFVAALRVLLLLQLLLPPLPLPLLELLSPRRPGARGAVPGGGAPPPPPGSTSAFAFFNLTSATSATSPLRTPVARSAAASVRIPRAAAAAATALLAPAGRRLCSPPGR